MNDYVIDASVAVKWFFKEIFTEPALNLLSLQNHLHVPDFFLVEIDNVIAKRIRRGDTTIAYGRMVRADIRKIKMKYFRTELLSEAAFELSNRTKCSFYDCLYLALAIEFGAKLITADHRFCESLASADLARNVQWIGNL